MIMMDFSGFTEMLMLGFFMRGRHGTYPNGLTALELFQNRQSSLNALEHYQSVKVHDVGTESDDALTLPYQSLVNKAQNTSYKVEAGNYLAQALLQGCYPGSSSTPKPEKPVWSQPLSWKRSERAWTRSPRLLFYLWLREVRRSSTLLKLR